MADREEPDSNRPTSGSLADSLRRRQLVYGSLVDKQAERARRGKVLSEWLVEKWKERHCPFCDALEWTFDPEPVVLSRADQLGVGPAVYMVRCENCGVGVPISAETVGLFPEDEEPTR